MPLSYKPSHALASLLQSSQIRKMAKIDGLRWVWFSSSFLLVVLPMIYIDHELIHPEVCPSAPWPYAPSRTLPVVGDLLESRKLTSKWHDNHVIRYGMPHVIQRGMVQCDMIYRANPPPLSLFREHGTAGWVPAMRHRGDGMSACIALVDTS